MGNRRTVPAGRQAPALRRSRLRPLVALLGLVLGLVPLGGAQAADGAAQAVVAAATTTVSSDPGPPVLVAGETLRPGERRTSADGVDVVAMQTDGNLVVYGRGVARWSTGTNGNPGARVVLQRDHNLVVYSASNRALWQSGTNRGPQDASLYLWHGELALLNGEHVWASRSGYDRLRTGSSLQPGQRLVQSPFLGDRPSTVVMQGDGNLVHYRGFDGRATWSSGTAGNPGARAVMQTDGNLVVYSPSGRALWSSRTRGAGLTYVVSPYVRGYFCERPEQPVYVSGTYVVDRRDRPLVGFPVDVVQDLPDGPLCP